MTFVFAPLGTQHSSLQSNFVTDFHHVCRSFPTEFCKYWAHLHSLALEGKPDYEKLENVFCDFLIANGMMGDGEDETFSFPWDSVSKQFLAH